MREYLISRASHTPTLARTPVLAYGARGCKCLWQRSAHPFAHSQSLLGLDLYASLDV